MLLGALHGLAIIYGLLQFKGSLAPQKSTPKIHILGFLHFAGKRTRLDNISLNTTFFL